MECPKGTSLALVLLRHRMRWSPFAPASRYGAAYVKPRSTGQAQCTQRCGAQESQRQRQDAETIHPVEDKPWTSNRRSRAPCLFHTGALESAPGV